MRRNENAAPSVPVDVAAALRPRPEEIAARAFELYEHRGSVDGADFDDWLEAEHQLMRERTNELACV